MTKCISILFPGLLLLFSACSSETRASLEELDNTRYVNTFIGTGGHGHTFPGATTPYAMVQLSPDTRVFGWDACGGYHHSDSSILGFSHTHLSGTGISDLGDFLFMPFTGNNPQVVPGEPEDPDSGYRSRFSHQDEEAEPGYYAVRLKDDDILAELTASPRAGFHRYSYPDGELAGLIIDLSHTIYPDRNPSHSFRIISDTEIVGYKGSGGWAKVQHTWFHAKFNRPFSCTFYDAGEALPASDTASSRKLLAVLKFDAPEEGELLARVGISHVDQEGATKNLEAEIPHWDFEQVKDEAHALWKAELNRIETKGGSEDARVIFYTALYHTAINPSVFSDVDGRYRGMDQQIHQSEGQPIYTVFSLWDTFRSNHPLITITDPDLDNTFVNSLLSKYEQGGILPKWELVANYTGTMIGYNAVPVIVDAYFKGIRDFDVEQAYQAMVEASNYQVEGILFPSDRIKGKLSPMAKKYNAELGFIPADKSGGSVSRALEYAYNDWCIAQMAKDLGKMEDYETYMERSSRYAQYYDHRVGFMRGKNADGQWREPFDPRFSEFTNGKDYTEGNAFQWSWFVPHDVEGLAQVMGGKEVFAAKLDTLFSTKAEVKGEKTADITGLIGQYAHGNEPSHHISHMYNFVGQSWKTQELAHQVMSELYFNDPNGLAGNEDCGAMSSWYVLNAMGFYSFCPGDPVYSVGRPIFDEVIIHLSNGREFKVVTRDNSPEHMYVQSASLNGKQLDAPFFSHEDILQGSTLEFEMGPTPKQGLWAAE